MFRNVEQRFVKEHYDLDIAAFSSLPMFPLLEDLDIILRQRLLKDREALNEDGEKTKQTARTLRGRKKTNQLNEDSDDTKDAIAKGALRFSFIDYVAVPTLIKRENTEKRRGTAGGDREIASSHNN